MDIIYQLQDLLFEWNPSKAAANSAKHGITFEEAAEVFFDPFYKIGDASADDAEQRDGIIGYSFNLRLLLVVSTDRGDRNRIISARVATRAERKLYEQS